MKRILYLASSNYGLGHFQRMTNIIRAASRQSARTRNTLVYAGPTLRWVRPPGCDLVLLPAYRYCGPNFIARPDLGPGQTIALHRRERAEALRTVARLPVDVLVLEYFPFGRSELRGDVERLVSTLRNRNPGMRVFISVRDVLADSDLELRIYAAQFVASEVDYVLVHSDATVFDMETCFGYEPEFHDKILHTGTVVGPVPRRTSRIRGSVVVGVGGGRDAELLLRRLPMLARRARDFLGGVGDLIVYPGPLALPFCFQFTKNVTIRTESHRFRSDLAHAELYIGMCGYNSSYEALALGVPSLVLPRPRREQMVRASVFVRRGWVGRVDLPDSTPPGSEFYLPLDLGGADVTAQVLLDA